MVEYKNLKKNGVIKMSNFRKTHHFSYQKQHIIIAFTTENKPLVLNICSIESYAEIFTTKQIIDTLVVDKTKNIT